MTRTLAPQWECSREFSVADVNRVKFTIRIFDLDALGIDDALGDVDLDLKELFAQEEAVNFGRRTTKVSRQSRTFACGPTSLGSYVARRGKCMSHCGLTAVWWACVWQVNQRWFRIRKPGPVVEKELTVADLKQVGRDSWPCCLAEQGSLSNVIAAQDSMSL